jgi:hypothetical protein
MMRCPMKRVACIGIILFVLTVFACGRSSVEDAAKSYVKKHLAFDNNVQVDASKLKYSVEKKAGNRAIVKVSGTINFDGRLFLVKQGSKWKIGKREDFSVTPEKTISQPQQKEVVSQTAHK